MSPVGPRSKYDLRHGLCRFRFQLGRPLPLPQGANVFLRARGIFIFLALGAPLTKEKDEEMREGRGPFRKS